MPRLSRWFIKIGLIYFIIGLTLSFIVLVQPTLGWSSQLQVLRPVYLHFLFIGWVTQIIMGVGYWMFPKYSKESPRGNEKLGWVVFILLNLGLILRGVSEPMMVIDPQTSWGWVLALASMFLLLAGWGFIFNTWGRIKER